MEADKSEEMSVEKKEPKKEDEFTTYFTDGKVDIPESEKVCDKLVQLYEEILICTLRQGSAFESF